MPYYPQTPGIYPYTTATAIGGRNGHTKSDDGMTYTIAVVGTNVGPYLVAALGASNESATNAKSLALKVFQALSSAVA